ncbi:MAG: hypothetical protein ACL7AX_10005 [Candidatus Arsenophonus phytopathogenicus]
MKERKTGKENTKETDDLLRTRRQMVTEGKRCTVEFLALNKAIWKNIPLMYIRGPQGCEEKRIKEIIDRNPNMKILKQDLTMGRKEIRVLLDGE